MIGLIKIASIRSSLEVGDLLFSNPKTPKTTRRLWVEMPQGTRFGHSAIYVGGGKVVESQISRGVILTDLNKFMDRNEVVVGRVNTSSKNKAKSAKIARALVGKQYDIWQAVRALINPRDDKAEVKQELENIKGLFCGAVLAISYPDIDFKSGRRMTDILPVDILKSPHVRIIGNNIEKEESLFDLSRVRPSFAK